MKIKVSRHAEKRMRERCGLNKRTVEKMAQRAFDKGISHSESCGRLSKWITSLYFKNKNANNIRIYGEMAYIFSDNVLITVFRVPNNILKDIDYMTRGRD